MGRELLALIDSCDPEKGILEESVVMQLAEEITKNHPVLNVFFPDEHTLLIAAIRREQSQVVRFLLSMGANPRLAMPGTMLRFIGRPRLMIPVYWNIL